MKKFRNINFGVLLLGALVVFASYAIDPVATAAVLPGLFAFNDPAGIGLSVLALGPVLDVFKQDAFSVISLTDSINKRPFIPGRAGAVAGWAEQGVATTTVMIEQVGSELRLVNPSPRGGPGSAFEKNKADVRILRIPHYQIDDGINADEVQGVRAFGSENQVMTVRGLVDQRMQQHVQEKLDPTLEFQRIGAIKGVILNGDLTTLYNLFDEFDVTQEAEIPFDLSAASPANGVLDKLCRGIYRTIASNLDGIPFTDVYAFCGDAFFDALIAHTEVTRTYLNQQEAAQLRNFTKAYGSFRFGNITWENYRGAVGGTSFVDTDECHIFPLGVPGFFRTINAPADYTETVNTMGLPRYARQWEMHNGKGVHLEVQMNPLNYCTRPTALLKGRRGS